MAETNWTTLSSSYSLAKSLSHEFDFVFFQANTSHTDPKYKVLCAWVFKEMTAAIQVCYARQRTFHFNAFLYIRMHLNGRVNPVQVSSAAPLSSLLFAQSTRSFSLHNLSIITLSHLLLNHVVSSSLLLAGWMRCSRFKTKTSPSSNTTTATAPAAAFCFHYYHQNVYRNESISFKSIQKMLINNIWRHSQLTYG